MKYTTVEKLTPGMMLGQSLIGISDAENYTVGHVLTAEDIHFLEEKGLFGIYTMEAQPAQILSPGLMQKCIQAINNTDIAAIVSLASELVADLTSRPVNLDFRSIRSFDDYLPHHSICVAVYAVATGIQLGFGDIQLNFLAQAGLLHDIGHIPQSHSVLMKKESLSPEELEQLKKHPHDGYTILSKFEQIPSIVKEAVLHHHENVNGSGYPEGLNQDTIPPLAKILHVVDVYDAIMSKRPYKSGMSSIEAINYLIGGKMILFDEHIVDKFLEVAVPYPTGCDLLLSNNEVVTVVSQTSDKLRPRIFSEKNQCIIDLATNADYADIQILKDNDYKEFTPHTSADSTATVEATASPADSGRKKILIVDDVFVSIAYTKLSLGNHYDIVTCLGGSLALKTVMIEKPDLILMDYEMPDMDGVRTVNELHKAGFHIPVIFLTGKCDRETVKKCGQCGAVDYILKPANPVYLQARVHMALYNAGVHTFN